MKALRIVSSRLTRTIQVWQATSLSLTNESWSLPTSKAKVFLQTLGPILQWSKAKTTRQFSFCFIHRKRMAEATATLRTITSPIAPTAATVQTHLRATSTRTNHATQCVKWTNRAELMPCTRSASNCTHSSTLITWESYTWDCASTPLQLLCSLSHSSF